MKRGWRLRPAGSNPHGIPGRPQTDQPKGAAQQALAAAVQLIIGDGLLRPPQHAVGHQQLRVELAGGVLRGWEWGGASTRGGYRGVRGGKCDCGFAGMWLLQGVADGAGTSRATRSVALALSL